MHEPTEDILSIKPGEVTVRATITSKYAHRIRNGNLMTDAVISDKTGTTKAVWFSKQPKDELKVGSEYVLSGNYQLKYGRLALQSPRYEATGEAHAMDELANSPLVLPARDYPSQKSSRRNLPDWVGVALFWLLVIGAVVGYTAYHNSQSTTTATSTSQNSTAADSNSAGSTSSSNSNSTCTPTSTTTGNHNGIPEIHCPGQSEANSKCIDVTSIDYDWDDDVLCTQPNGSQFYTNYAGGQTADPSFEL
jgi:hypothetical protein